MSNYRLFLIYYVFMIWFDAEESHSPNIYLEICLIEKVKLSCAENSTVTFQLFNIVAGLNL